jgi:hypothetical protein
LWINEGKLAFEGTADAAVNRYFDSVRDGFVVGGAKPDDKLAIERVILKDGAGEVTSMFRGDGDLTVEVHYEARGRIEHPHFIIAVLASYGPLFAANMQFDELTPAAIEGKGVVACKFHPPFLLPQPYSIAIGARDAQGTPIMGTKYDAAFFNVVGLMNEYGFPGQNADALVADATSMIVPYEWHLPDGRVVVGPIEGRGGKKS